MKGKNFFKFFIFLLIIPIFAVSLGNCSAPEIKIAALDDSKATKEGIKKTVEGSNRFALELYKELAYTPQYKDENIFFSPWSIQAALSMTYEGARGKTAEEMESVLHLPENDTIRRSSFARLYNLMNIKKEYELSLANALWPQKGFPILDSYLDINKNYYGAKVESLDFRNHLKEAVKRINEWVKNETKDKIKRLVTETMLRRVTPIVLVLTNAIYFKGDWVRQFNKELTKEEDFKVSPEKTVKVPMMRHTKELKFNYTETKELKALKLPYKGGDLSMLILLPKEDFGLPKLEAKLSPKMLEDLEEDLHEEKVRVYLPKFKLKTEYDLVKVLKEMGMVVPFTGNANFSGIAKNMVIWIDAVKHKAFINVNEEGTEAAGATAVIIVLSVPKIFRADHPFFFLIKDERTNMILFLGKVINPGKV